MSRRSFWPDEVERPYLRLILALLLAPLIWSLVATAFAFAVVALTSPSMDAAVAYMVEVTLTAMGLMFGFTLTLGLLGILVLWMLDQRSSLAWALSGAIFGAVGAVLNGFLVQDGQFDRALLLIFVIIGWSLFLTIRWIAGIRDAPAG
ncbi:MAG: hypothetical protein AAGI70_09940, partial [Pseudomonadota bacterium]